MALEGEGVRAAGSLWRKGRSGELRQWVFCRFWWEKDRCILGIEGRQVRRPWQVSSFLPMQELDCPGTCDVQTSKYRAPESHVYFREGDLIYLGLGLKYS